MKTNSAYFLCRRPTFWACLMLAAGMSGCLCDLGTIPDEANISCTSNEDCSKLDSKLTCQVNVGRCVSVNALAEQGALSIFDLQAGAEGRFSKNAPHDRIEFTFKLNQDLTYFSPGTLQPSDVGFEVGLRAPDGTLAAPEGNGCESTVTGPSSAPVENVLCNWQVDADMAPGEHILQVLARDKLGQEDAKLLPIVIDVEGPVLDLADVSPQLAGRETVVGLQIIANEKLGEAPPEIRFPDASGATPSVNLLPSTSYLFLVNPFDENAGEFVADGDYAIEVRMTDALGNTSDWLEGPTITFNTSQPTFTHGPDDVSFHSAIDPYNQMQVDFRCVDGPTLEDPCWRVAVSVGGDATECVVDPDTMTPLADHCMNCVPFQWDSEDEPLGRRCTRTVLPTDPEGLNFLNVLAWDRAQNFEYIGDVPVILDFEPPRVFDGAAEILYDPHDDNPRFFVSALGPRSSVQVNLAFDEELGFDEMACANAFALEARDPNSGDSVMSFTFNAGFSIGNLAVFDGEYPSTQPPADGEYPLFVQACDTLGNIGFQPVADFASGGNMNPVRVRLDGTAPNPVDTSGATVLHLRAPFGVEDTDYLPASVLVGEVDAATDATLVQAVEVIDVAHCDPRNFSTQDEHNEELCPPLGRGEVQDDVVVHPNPAVPGPFAKGFEFLLDIPDAPVVHIRLLDRAGNFSAPAKVLNGGWVASLNRKEPGSLISNPTTLIEADRFNTARISDPQSAGEPPDYLLDQVHQSDGAYHTRQSQPNWVELAHQDALPPIRHDFNAVFDSIEGKILLFGGRSLSVGGEPCGFSGEDLCEDTWIWDPAQSAFTEVTSPFQPFMVREGHAMAFNPFNGEIIRFGGKVRSGQCPNSSGTICDDTWRWDRNLMQWVPLPLDPAGAKPPPRTRGRLAFDRARRVFVLFGGFSNDANDDSSPLQDTWELSGNTWTQVLSSAPFAARGGHAMTYHPGFERVLLHGGDSGGSSPTRYSDAWSFDGSAWSAVPMNDVGDVLGPRTRHHVVFDTQLDTLLLFGGDGNGPGCVDAGGNVTCSDTWMLVGNDWQVQTNGVATFGAETMKDGVMVHDPHGGLSYVIGGMQRSGLSTMNVWSYNSAGPLWVNRTPRPEKPPAVFQGALAYDSNRNWSVLFGGQCISGDVDCEASTNSAWPMETWIWYGGSSWVDYSFVGQPRPRQAHAMAYHPIRGEILMFGGINGTINATTDCDGTGTVFCDAVWRFGNSGNTIRWEEVPHLNADPGPRYGHSWVYDPVQGGLALYGGFDPAGTRQSELWLWDDGNWSLVSATPDPTHGSPPRLAFHAMAFDEVTQELVLFGGDAGSSMFGETWVLDSATTTWRRAAAAGGNSPPARSDHTLIYDRERARVLLYGGSNHSSSCNDGGAICSDLWEWDGAGWSEVFPDGVFPEPREGHAATFDSRQNRMTVFGGTSGGTNCNRSGHGGCRDLWGWVSHGDDTPALTWFIPFAFAEVPDAIPLGMSASLIAGGTGTDEMGNTVHGVDIYAWKPGAGGTWERIDNAGGTDGPADSPESIFFEAVDPTEVPDFLFGGDREIALTVVPKAPNGSGDDGAISLDYAEALLLYRLPADP
jgi:hypothetical protein